MKKAFPGHFANDPDDLKRLWENSLIAVDANVLLNLYRFSDSTRDEFLAVFEKLKDRLWISHQVAAEYLRNRLKVISDQAKTYDVAIEGLEALRQSFENPKQHPFVSVEMLGDCTRSFDLIIGELKANKNRHDAKINEDDIKDKLALIFEGKVGEAYSIERLEELIAEGAVRYENKIPPGFKDAVKAGGKTFEDRLAPYGDFVGWMQLLEKAKNDAINIIYVTGDNKEDWWLKQSGKTLGPLPALVVEFTKFTSKQFYQYPPDRFLERAGVFLEQAVSPQAMAEAREVRLEDIPQVSEFSKSTHHVNVDWKNIKNFVIEHNLASSKRLRNLYWSTNQDGNVGLESLRAQATALRYEMRDIDAELDRRLIEGPSDSFIGFTDEELQELFTRRSNEFKEVVGAIEVLKSFGERDSEGGAV